jgi:hypothetical protein
MRSTDATGLSGVFRKAVRLTAEFAGVVRDLIKDVRDSYRREPIYVRVRNPEWPAAHRRVSRPRTYRR